MDFFYNIHALCSLSNVCRYILVHLYDVKWTYFSRNLMLDISNLIQISSVLLSRRSMPGPTKGSELTVIGLPKKNVEMMDQLHSSPKTSGYVTKSFNMTLLLPVIDWFHLCCVGLIEKVLQSRSGL